MNYHPKLKWSTGLYYPVVILSSYIFAILELVLRKYLRRNGMEILPFPIVTYILVGLFFAGMGIYQWHKFRLWIYLATGMILGLLCFQAPSIFDHGFNPFKVTYVITLIILILFVVINWHTFYSHERFEINSRRLFRLAAHQIADHTDGFTERPYPAGQVEFNREEILGLSRFLNGKFVVRSFHTETGIYLAFSMNKSLVAADDPKEVSHITLGADGHVHVVIAEKDYREYVDRVSFDKLCDSMARVFIRFLDYYRQGLENRIITELKSAR